jgi:aspartyl-tRNA synthetase
MTLIAFSATTYRSHLCGALRASHVDATVTLSGWVARKRDHGGILFIDLRDNDGITQVVATGSLYNLLASVRVESVVRISGRVVRRQDDLINKKLPTGEIEVHVSEAEVLSVAEVLPFQIADEDKVSEQLRLTYRFLDLRRDTLHSSILLRSKVIREIRDLMHSFGFHEFQTPILTSSSPEGARDFLVPSRVHPGKFFALPQAPQQFKQLLMVSGFDRYFQIAPCFRDEDARADRSPGEFYQLDIEMSFVEQDDVFALGEELFTKLFKKFAPSSTVTTAPFPRIPYRESMARYGTDKPDLRNPLVMCEVTNQVMSTTFRVIQQEIAQGGKVIALPIPVDELPSRKYLDESVEFFSSLTGKGLGFLLGSPEGVKGSFAKLLSSEEIGDIITTCRISSPSWVIFLAAGKASDILPALGKLRTKCGEDFQLVEPNSYRFCWVTDFPMFEYNEDLKKIDFSHNPFSMPQGGLEALDTKDPLEISAYQYDIVCNGYELSSGAIRNHLPEVAYRAFEIAGYARETVDEKFGGMIRAFGFGAPPHGGFAPGIDRIVMLLANATAIREVIAFPLSQTVEDLLMGAPSAVSEQQLKDAHILLRPPQIK